MNRGKLGPERVTVSMGVWPLFWSGFDKVLELAVEGKILGTSADVVVKGGAGAGAVVVGWKEEYFDAFVLE